MSNFKQELSNYICSKHKIWAETTSKSAFHKLMTIHENGGFKDPGAVFNSLSFKGYGPYSIKTYFILARQFETEVHRTARFKQWMAQNKKVFKNAYKRKNLALTENQFVSFLKEAPSKDLANFLILMAKGGLRKMEALKAEWAHLKNGELEIPSGKGGKQRFVPFNKDWLLPTKSLTILPPSLVYWKFFKEKLSPFTPHDFRSYYATKVVNIPGMSIEDARQLLGHENIETTARYLRANKEKQSKLILENFK